MGKEELIEKIMKHLDKLEKVPDVAMKAGLAYLGYKSVNHWSGAITALIGLKLATGNNLAGGAAGVSTLTLIGLGNAFKNFRAEERITEHGEPNIYPWTQP